MDKYTKFILTIIAVGIIGLNLKLYDANLFTDAKAGSHIIHKIMICDDNGDCANVDMTGSLQIN